MSKREEFMSEAQPSVTEMENRLQQRALDEEEKKLAYMKEEGYILPDNAGFLEYDCKDGTRIIIIENCIPIEVQDVKAADLYGTGWVLPLKQYSCSILEGDLGVRIGWLNTVTDSVVCACEQWEDLKDYASRLTNRKGGK
jgi:hypothetical protein